MVEYLFTDYFLEPNCRGIQHQIFEKDTTHFHLLTPHQTTIFTKKSIFPRLLEPP